jgi:ATP-dependent Clp protease protease subunit
MIHQPLGGAEGQASDIEIQAREILWLKQRLFEILADHTGQDFDKVEEDSDRNYWMSAEEAADYGVVDNVLEKKKLSEIKKQSKGSDTPTLDDDASDDDTEDDA